MELKINTALLNAPYCISIAFKLFVYKTKKPEIVCDDILQVSNQNNNKKT